MMRVVLLVCLLVHGVAQAATYYIAPTGSDSSNGQSPSTPWLTFAHAFSNSACGDTLFLMDGTYGDGTSTGKINVTKVCTAGSVYTIRAQNQRQAKILDTAGGKAVWVQNSAYVVLDGLYGRATDNASFGPTTSEAGVPVQVRSSSNIIVRNGVWRNPNRYSNTAATGAYFSDHVLFEDNEVYTFHRHCFTAWKSQQITVRRQYCNPRGGRISGGYNAGVGLGGADSVMSMYPCRECILENSIADGTTHPMFFNEMNATFGDGIVLTGSKVLGGICYKCNYETSIFINSRNVAGLNNTPQNITVRDFATVDWDPPSGNMVRVSDGVNITLDHITGLSDPAVSLTTQHGISTDDGGGATRGTTAAENSIAMSNILIRGAKDRGFNINGFNTWTGSNIYSNSNGTAFFPDATNPNWTNESTTDPVMGTCKLWVPDGSPGKGAGTGGSDIGATILYRYVDGVLTPTPLWDPVTGAFPHGAADLDGTNRVAGESLFDIHTRLNVNANGCDFPAGYVMGGGGTPSTVTRGTQASSGTSATATPLTWNQTVSSSQDLLTVCVGMWDSGATVGSVSSIDVSGQPMTFVKRQVTSPDAFRAVELWKLISPTAGSRTITATLTGNIGGVLGRSTEFAGTSGLNTAVGGSTNGPASLLSVTADTNESERVEDCTVSSKAVTYSHGDDQTGDAHLDHSTQSLRLATSTQNGSDGGVMSNSTGGTVLQAKVAVSLIPGTPDPPSTATLTLTKYRIYDGYGTESGAAPLSAFDTPLETPIFGMVRIRAQVTGSGATTNPVGVQLWCRRNADPFTQALNTFGANTFRLFGPESESESTPIPATNTPTTEQLTTSSGVFVPGKVYNDANASVSLPPLTVGQQTELVSNVVFDTTAGTMECQYYTDGGVPIPADDGKVPTLTMRAPNFSLP